MNFKPLTLVNLGHHSLLLAILLLCTFSTAVEAQSSRAVPLPVFTVTDQPAVEKGAFLAAPPSWRPTSSMQPSAVSPDAIALTSGRWQTYGPGWTLAGNRAEIVHTPAGTPSYLVSPAFRVPEGRQLLRYSEKFSLESYRDYGSVWILAEDDSSWRKVHTLTGAADWRDTYLNLSPYAGRSIRVAFLLSADASVAGAGWEIGDMAVVRPHRPVAQRVGKTSNRPVEKVLNTLNLILTGRETNTFPRISATVRAEDIPDLTKMNFAVTENGVEQAFDIVLPQGGVARPADIVFIVDNSGSMGPFQTAISNTINDFVTELFDAGVNAALGLTRFGQSSFGGNPIVEENGTLLTDPTTFLNTVFTRNVSSGFFEPGLNAINASLSTFNFRPNSQKIFILLTNEDNDGSTEPGDVLPGLETNAVSLFSLIAPFSGNSQFDYGDLAVNSGGQQFNIADVSDPSTLEPIIDAIEDNIATEDAYIVSYTTDNPALDGIERTVDIIATLADQKDTVTFQYTPGAAPIIALTAGTVALIDSPQPVGVPLTIQATITDLSEPLVQSASLLYRLTGQATYTAVPLLNVSDDLYEAEIPAGVVQMPGVDFYLTATDGISTTSDRATSPAENPYQIAVNPNVAPVITSTPVVSLTVGEDLVVTAEIVDNTNTVSSASLFYRNVGEPLYNAVPCTNTGGDTYVATVSGGLLSQSGVEYYIRATDDFGINAYFGTPDDPIRVAILPVVNVPTVLTLAPTTVTVVAGVEICIVGTVFDQFGDPLPGIEVFTEVDGTLVGSGISDEAGEVEYCFTPTESGVVNVVCFYQGGDRVTAEVTVTEAAQTTFTLIDAETDTDLFVMQDGDVYAVADLPESLTIRADFDPESIGSAAFRFKGPFQHWQVENVPAYALFGNDHDDYNGRLFPPGVYRLRVTPYSEAALKGDEGTTLEINFTITAGPVPDDLSVVGFDLYDATTDNLLQRLADGDVIDLDALDNNNLGVSVETMPDFVGSVQIELSGPMSRVHIENVRPYSLFGNNSTDFSGRPFLPGDYTLKATAFAGSNATGVAGPPLEIQFEVIGGNVSKADRQLIYPMPFQRQFTVENLDGSPIKMVQVYDQTGRAIRATVQTGQWGATVILPDGTHQSTIIVRTVSEDDSVRSTMIQRVR